jgi:galactoside O-acetyltransferase
MKIGKDVIIHPTVQIFNDDAIEIGDNVRIDAFCVLSGGSGLKIGSHIHIACGNYLFAGAGIEIDDFCQIGAQCIIHSQSDDFSGHSMIGPCIPMKYKPGFKSGKVILERHVVLGARCTVLPETYLCKGAAFGAHSLITSNQYMAWKIYAGTPAKFIKVRYPIALNLEKAFLDEYESINS